MMHGRLNIKFLDVFSFRLTIEIIKIKKCKLIETELYNSSILCTRWRTS